MEVIVINIYILATKYYPNTEYITHWYMDMYDIDLVNNIR